LDALHNKWTFLQQAKKLTSRLPLTFFLTSWDKLEETMANNPTMDWILKQVYSRFSIGVQNLPKGTRPRPISISSQRPWILQEKIKGRQICTYSLAHKGKLLLHTAYTTPYTAGKGSGILFASYENSALQRAITEWVAEKKWTGHLSFDWIETASEELIPIECNPRITSGIHLFSDADRIDTAFTAPEKVEAVITPKIPQKRMLTLGMISFGLQSCTRMGQFIAWCKKIGTHQDVVFRWNDPVPMYSQLQSLWYFWKQSRRNKNTILQTSTEDIEWNGE
jgi:hypothetical protein